MFSLNKITTEAGAAQKLIIPELPRSLVEAKFTDKNPQLTSYPVFYSFLEIKPWCSVLYHCYLVSASLLLKSKGRPRSLSKRGSQSPSSIFKKPRNHEKCSFVLQTRLMSQRSGKRSAPIRVDLDEILLKFTGETGPFWKISARLFNQDLDRTYVGLPT